MEQGLVLNTVVDNIVQSFMNHEPRFETDSLLTGSQCKDLSTEVICSYLYLLLMTLAKEFRTVWNFCKLENRVAVQMETNAFNRVILADMNKKQTEQLLIINKSWICMYDDLNLNTPKADIVDKEHRRRHPVYKQYQST